MSDSSKNLFPGGMTWVDIEYNERLRAALYPSEVIQNDEALQQWYDEWTGEKDKLSDQDLLKMAKDNLQCHNVTRQMIRNLRKSPDGTPRRRGRKPGKTIAEFGRG